MNKKEIMNFMREALRSHYVWARVQRRRRYEGKKPIPHVGCETFHRDCVKAYKEALRVLNHGE